MPWYTPQEADAPVSGYLEESTQPRGYAWQNAIANGFGETLPSLAYEAGKRQARSEGRESLTRDEAMGRAKNAGVSVTVPDNGINAGALEVMIERQRRRARREAIVSSSNMNGVERFGAELFGSLPDPVNLIFLPLGGVEGSVARTGLGMVARKVGIGAAEGIVTTALAEPAYYALSRSAGDDYGMADSMMNIAFGGVTGGLFHAAPEVYRAAKGPAKDVFHSSMNRVRETRALLPHAVDQAVREERIDVEAPARALHEEVRARDLEEGFAVDAFHGTNRSFEQFNLEEGGSNTQARDAGQAIFFSDSPDVASGYARFAGDAENAFGPADEKLAEGANVRPVRLKEENPRVIDWKGEPYSQTKFLAEVLAAKRAGNDSIVFKNVNDDVSMEAGGAKKLSTVHAVFSPDQVRSRFGNISDAVTPANMKQAAPGLGSIHRTPAVEAEIANVNRRAEAPRVREPVVEPGEVDPNLDAELTDAIKEAQDQAKALDMEEALKNELAESDAEIKEVDDFTKSIESALLCSLRKGAP